MFILMYVDLLICDYEKFTEIDVYTKGYKKKLFTLKKLHKGITHLFDRYELRKDFENEINVYETYEWNEFLNQFTTLKFNNVYGFDLKNNKLLVSGVVLK